MIEVQLSDISERLNTAGAVLLRGFGVHNAKRLERTVKLFGKGFLNYIDGNSPRTKLSSKVYTSTEFPAEHLISMHNELSYSHLWPKTLFFACQTAPKDRGHTLIADCRKVLAALDPDIVQAFKQKQVSYTRYLHNGFGFGPSWQDTFETDDKQLIEQYCIEASIEFAWEGDNLRLKQTVPGVIEHPVTGEDVWFNQADQFHPANLPKELYDGIVAITQGKQDMFPTYATFGDGSEIPLDMFRAIQHTFALYTTRFEWEKGDVLLIDNALIAHGRDPFSGIRKILVAMN